MPIYILTLVRQYLWSPVQSEKAIAFNPQGQERRLKYFCDFHFPLLNLSFFKNATLRYICFF